MKGGGGSASGREEGRGSTQGITQLGVGRMDAMGAPREARKGKATMSTALGNQTITMLPAGQGESYLLLGTELVTIKVSAAQTGGALMTAEATIPPGSGPPLHRHQPQELFYVLEGEFAFPTLRDGQPHVVHATPGAVVHVPSWVPHTYKNVGVTPGRLLATFTPPTLEGYFRNLGDPVADPSAPPRPAGPPDWDRIAALHRTYHIEYLEPAP